MKTIIGSFVLLHVFVWSSLNANVSDLNPHNSHSRGDCYPVPILNPEPVEHGFPLNLPHIQSHCADESQNARTFFLFAGTGFLEFFGFGFGIQLGDGIAMALKSSSVFISGRGFMGPPSGTGVGIRTTITIPDLVLLQRLIHFNALRVEASYLFHVYHQEGKSRGVAVEVTTGHENFSSSCVSFFWSCGVAISAVDGIRPLFFPALKIGLNWNTP